MIGQCLDRRIGNMEKLCREVAARQARRDQIHAKVNRQFSTDQTQTVISDI